MPVITNIEDLRVLAQKRVPRMFYDYADSGSWTESTYRANEATSSKIKLRQRVAVNMENRSTAHDDDRQRRGHAGGHRADRPDRHAACRRRDPGGAGGRGSSASRSRCRTMSICSIEDVAAAHRRQPFWFQLYVMRDRDFIERLIDRAKAAELLARWC